MAKDTYKCKQCRKEVSRFEAIKVPAGNFCSFEHVIKFANEKRAEQIRKNARKADAAYRKKHRADKERIKTRSQWLKEAQSAINKYVRIRDKGKPCISCDKPDNGQHQRHASHFKSVGSNSALRFNLWNINASCSKCNAWLSGNIGGYTPRLIKKIGQEKFNWIETQNNTVKYDVDYLKRLKAIFNKRSRTLEKRLIDE